MLKSSSFVLLIMAVIILLVSAGCPKSVDESIRERVNITPLDEATHARDLAIQRAVEVNIRTNPVLDWYAKTYGGLTVEVSHAVATIHMKVKTQEQHDEAIRLARQTKDLRDIVDNIEIDPNLEDPPFDW